MDSASDSDDEPLANLVPRNQAPSTSTNRTAATYRWKKKDFQPPPAVFTGPTFQPPYDQRLKSPYEYFQQFVTNDMLENVVEHTNRYSVQKSGKSVNTTKKELEQVVGMFFQMGLVRMSSTRQYWEMGSTFEPVSSVMSRNRFQHLVTLIHFVDNTTVSDETKKDKLWKIRPWLTAMREQCLKVVPEEHSSIDEMMCQYRGKTSPIRQYIKSKPHPWGFKVWGRAGPSAILYDFDVYQGGDGARSQLGQGGDVIMKLTSTLEKNCNYKIYADNLFTSVGLLEKLSADGILYTGTVRQNRLPKCDLASEKDLKKQGRGAYDYRVEEQHNIAAVRWYDNRAVSLLSTQAGVEPLQTAKRWDKKKREQVQVTMPHVVSIYNQYMGGVDMLDSFLAKYRFRMRSRRWYMYLFWHFLSVALVNAWQLYRRDHSLLGFPEKQNISQRRFQADVAGALVLVNTERKRGRPSADSPLPMSKRRVANLPCTDVRKDKIAHWPAKCDKRGRCRMCEKNNTNTKCTKCDVRLCFVEERNCFVNFHL